MNASKSERIDGPTPAGGVASVAYFRDADGNPCPKDEAVGIEIHELDAAGTAIRRTHLIRQPKGDET
jgi:hypothetical protein